MNCNALCFNTTKETEEHTDTLHQLLLGSYGMVLSYLFFYLKKGNDLNRLGACVHSVYVCSVVDDLGARSGAPAIVNLLRAGTCASVKKNEMQKKYAYVGNGEVLLSQDLDEALVGRLQKILCILNGQKISTQFNVRSCQGRFGGHRCSCSWAWRPRRGPSTAE